MWNQPYLETCCRSALHRLSLAGELGRPPGLKDGGCLDRLVRDGFARVREDGRLVMTQDGWARHAAEIQEERPSFLKKSGARPPRSKKLFLF